MWFRKRQGAGTAATAAGPSPRLQAPDSAAVATLWLVGALTPPRSEVRTQTAQCRSVSWLSPDRPRPAARILVSRRTAPLLQRVIRPIWLRRKLPGARSEGYAAPA